MSLETSTKRFCSLVDEECIKSIIDFLESCYRPYLKTKSMKLEDSLVKRRFLDFTMLYLITHRGIKEIPGLILIKKYITKKEEIELLEEIDSKEWDTTLKRRTQQYGYRYNYESKQALEKAPKIFRSLKKVWPFTVDQVIINEYNRGQGISAHIDKIDQLGDYVAGISLGSDATFEFVRVEDKHKEEIKIPRRSIFIMTYDSRYSWTHSLPAKKSSLKKKRRVSITYRHLRETYPPDVKDFDLISKNLESVFQNKEDSEEKNGGKR